MTKQELQELADLLYPNVKPVDHWFKLFPSRKTKGEITRVAPSPTGYLHIGTLYQALINKLSADKTNGSFIMRLEDTDTKREIENAGKIAYDMLCAYGLTPNEGYTGGDKEIGDYGPYVQTKRIDIYHSFAHELVKRGGAFPCFCKKTEGKEDVLKKREEELTENNDLESKDPCRDLTLTEIKNNLKAGKPFALRLRSTGDFNKTHEITDLILGKKEIRENSRDDVLIKSNGVPVYAFAHIVDDTLMHTTTIVRGQDWYQSLPVHLELSRAFGFEPFKYAHTPNICKNDEITGNKRKLSKRKDAVADARYFLHQGYPEIAVVEYLLNLLNSDFEIWRKNNPTLPYTDFPFSIKKIGVTNPMFDFLKLNDISKTIISRMSAEEVYKNALQNAKEWRKEDVSLLEQNKQNLIKVFSIDRGGDRPRKDITMYSEIPTLYDYVLPNFKPNYKEVDLGSVTKQNAINFLTCYKQNYTEQTDNTSWFEHLKQVALVSNFVDNKTYKQSPDSYAGSVTDASKFVRLAITGKVNSPELFSIMKILGVNECKTRINKLIEALSKN